MREITAEQNGVAIGLAPRDMFGGDIGTRTRAIIHDDGGAAQFARQGITQRTREKIAGTTGWKADHEPNGPPGWPGGAGLRAGVLRCDAKRDGGGEEASAVDHGFLLGFPEALCDLARQMLAGQAGMFNRRLFFAVPNHYESSMGLQ
jgi:hypothetical protein